MKRLLALVLALCLVLTFAACSKPAEESATQEPAAETPADTTEKPAETPDAPSDETPAETTDASNIKVAGVVFQEDQFMKLVQMGYEAAAKDYGVEYNLANTNGDTTKELELINTYVAQGFDGVAICPINETTSIEALRSASSEGLKVAISNLSLDGDFDFISCGYTSDQYALCATSGEMAAKYIQEHFEKGSTIKIGRLGAMSVLPDITRDRWAGFLDQLEALEDYTIEVVAEQDAWLQDEVIQAVDDMLTANPDIDIFYGFNDGSTIGATMAIKNAGVDDVVVFGIDANEQICNMLLSDDNILQATTSQDPYTMGYLTMEGLIKGLRGDDISDIEGKTFETSYVPLERTDPDGVNAYLDDLHSKMG